MPQGGGPKFTPCVPVPRLGWAPRTLSPRDFLSCLRCPIGVTGVPHTCPWAALGAPPCMPSVPFYPGLGTACKAEPPICGTIPSTATMKAGKVWLFGFRGTFQTVGTGPETGPFAREAGRRTGTAGPSQGCLPSSAFSTKPRF